MNNKYVTAFFGEKPVNKTYHYQGGSLVKGDAVSFRFGNAIKLPCENLQELKEILVKYQNNPRFCLSLGYHHAVDENVLYKIVKQDQLNNGVDKFENGIVITARLKSKMRQSCFVMFDYDAKGSNLSYDDWNKSINEVIPQFEHVGKIMTSSNSARVGYDNSNFHIYVEMDDTTQLLDFGRNLSSHLEEKLDSSTFGRERVIYEGCPIILDNVTPSANIQFKDGEKLKFVNIEPKQGSVKARADDQDSKILIDYEKLDLFTPFKIDNNRTVTLWEIRKEIKALPTSYTETPAGYEGCIRCWVDHLRPESKSQNGKIWNINGFPVIRDYNHDGIAVNYALGDENSRLAWMLDVESEYVKKCVAIGSAISSKKIVVVEDDVYFNCRLKRFDYQLKKIPSHDEADAISILDNLGADITVCRVIMNYCYKKGSKFYSTSGDGYTTEHALNLIPKAFSLKYGSILESYNPQDESDAVRYKDALSTVIAYIDTVNQVTDLYLNVSFHQKLTTLDFLNSTFGGSKNLQITYPYCEYKAVSNIDHLSLSYRDAVVENYKDYYKGLPNLLKFIVYSRFTDNNRESFMWFKAHSGWGKSLLFDTLNQLGILFKFKDHDVFIKTISGTPYGIDKGKYLASLGFYVDEFDRLHKSMKTADSFIEINPKGEQPFSLPTYSKIFISHQEINGLSEGVDDEMGNRMLFENPSNSKTMRDNALFSKNSIDYKIVLEHFLVDEVNTLVNEAKNLPQKDIGQWLSEYFERESVKNAIGDTSGDILKDAVEDIKQMIEEFENLNLAGIGSGDILHERFPDKKLLIEHYLSNNVRINNEVFLKSSSKFIKLYIEYEYAYDPQLLETMRKIKREVHKGISEDGIVVKNVNGRTMKLLKIA